MVRPIGEVFPRPILRNLQGTVPSFDVSWPHGPAVVAIGHRDCKTTRQTVPYVERLFRRKAASATVILILQDDAKAARSLAEAQGLTLPIFLEPHPYPLARGLKLEVVPSLYAVSAEGRIESVIEGFDRRGLEAMARHAGVTGPFFEAADSGPAFRPG